MGRQVFPVNAQRIKSWVGCTKYPTRDSGGNGEVRLLDIPQTEVVEGGQRLRNFTYTEVHGRF